MEFAVPEAPTFGAKANVRPETRSRIEEVAGKAHGANRINLDTGDGRAADVRYKPNIAAIIADDRTLGCTGGCGRRILLGIERR